MQWTPRTIGWLDCLLGLLFIALAIPLIRKRIPMNRWYGVRLPQSFTSDANWYAINCLGGKCLAVGGALTVLVGIVALILPPRSEFGADLYVLAPAVICLLVLIPVVRQASRLT
jgi:hypothetical protein